MSRRCFGLVIEASLWHIRDIALEQQVLFNLVNFHLEMRRGVYISGEWGRCRVLVRILRLVEFLRDGALDFIDSASQISDLVLKFIIGSTVFLVASLFERSEERLLLSAWL